MTETCTQGTCTHRMKYDWGLHTGHWSAQNDNCWSPAHGAQERAGTESDGEESLEHRQLFGACWYTAAGTKIEPGGLTKSTCWVEDVCLKERPQSSANASQSFTKGRMGQALKDTCGFTCKLWQIPVNLHTSSEGYLWIYMQIYMQTLKDTCEITCKISLAWSYRCKNKKEGFQSILCFLTLFQT